MANFIGDYEWTTDDKGRNILRGSEDDDVNNSELYLYGQPILMYGYGGDDKLVTGSTADELYGGEGNDYLDGRGGVDKLVGGNGNDLYIVDLTAAGKLQDRITEGAGATSGIDTLKLRGEVALNKPATINLVANVENLDASATGSTLLNLTGNKLDNSLIGNDADNILNGGKGVDTFAGGKGNDTYVIDQAVELANITENSGEGSADTLQVAYSNTSKTTAFEIDLGAVNLANIENVNLVGKGLFNVTGNDLDNVLTGNLSSNHLSGGAGADVLIGGLGADVLTGGTGADTFVFSSKLSAKLNVDTITDFLHGEDKIELSTAIFKKLRGDTDLTDNISTDGIAHDATDYILYNSTTGALSYDADGSGRGAAVQFATLTGNPSLDAADFTLTPILA